MIPDGVHSQQEDWTIFMLNQTPDSIVEPVIADADSVNGTESDQEETELLYVLNLVRTKHDKTLRRLVFYPTPQLSDRMSYLSL